MTTFSDIVEAADDLSIDEQKTLVEILRRRIAELDRAVLAQEVEQAREEFRAGKGRSASANEIMNEVGANS